MFGLQEEDRYVEAASLKRSSRSCVRLTFLLQGSTIADAIRQIGVSEVTFYRWRKEYGGMKTDQLRRLKELEKENERLRRAVSDLTLDKLILKGAKETSEPLRRRHCIDHARKRLGGVSERRGLSRARSCRSTQRQYPARPCGRRPPRCRHDRTGSSVAGTVIDASQPCFQLSRLAGRRQAHLAAMAAGRAEKSLTDSGSGAVCGFNDGSCTRLRPQHRNHVWSYDFFTSVPMTSAPSGR